MVCEEGILSTGNDNLYRKDAAILCERGHCELEVKSWAEDSARKESICRRFYEGVFDELLKDENDELLNKVLSDLAEIEEINEGQQAQIYLNKKMGSLQNVKVKKCDSEAHYKSGTMF